MSAVTAREATDIQLTGGHLNAETTLVTTPIPSGKIIPGVNNLPTPPVAVPVIVRAAIDYTPDSTTSSCVVKVYRINTNVAPVLLKTVSVI